MSYFYSKNGGYQFRMINPNMSELVKNDPRFALTREYGWAFGEGAGFSGALLKAISMRWRFIMRRNTHAILTTKYNQYFKEDSGLDPGGTAHISMNYGNMRNDFNALNKTTIPNWVTYFFPRYTEEDIDNNQLVIQRALTASATDLDPWILKNAEGFDINLYTLRVKRTYLHGSDGYHPRFIAQLSSQTVAHNTVTFDGSDVYTVLPASTPALDGRLEPDLETCGGILVYIAPFRMIGGTKMVLQSLCSSYWYLPPVQSE